MNGHVGNQQQVPVNVQQLRLHPVFRFHRHSSRDGQRAVQPGGDEHTAVALHRHPGVSGGQFKILLDLEAGAVGVAGAHGKARNLSPGHPEGQKSRTAPGQIVFSPGKKAPFLLLKKPDIPLLLQGFAQIRLGVVDAVGCVQKGAQGLGAAVHQLSSFSLTSWQNRSI